MTKKPGAQKPSNQGASEKAAAGRGTDMEDEDFDRIAPGGNEEHGVEALHEASQRMLLRDDRI
jgi:hypothetical protein